ncbi:MAG TPA: hypothetical protein VK187_13635 [Geobacteraceae bacterium]|nr:hypothetical protein [Geobacteraceae bacterium]
MTVPSREGEEIEKISAHLDKILTHFAGILPPPLCRSRYSDTQEEQFPESRGGTVVKIYLFNPETGVYLGEDFADEIRGPQGALVRVIPPDATGIEPPQVEHGQTLVFNVRLQRWDVREGSASVRTSLYDKLAGQRASEVSS